MVFVKIQVSEIHQSADRGGEEESAEDRWDEVRIHDQDHYKHIEFYNKYADVKR